MENVIYAILVLGILGAVFGLLLAFAAKKFAVERDERYEPLVAALPGANCGGCGYAGCAGYADAVLKGEAEIGKCAAGGAASAAKMAEIMGVQADAGEKMVAFVRCSGTIGHRQVKYDYDGVLDCLSASRLSGGPVVCADGCLGFGNCVAACKFDAIHVQDGVATVDRDKCVGCLKCAEACPRGIITSVPYSAPYVSPCASKAKGAAVKKMCDFGCIGCTLCAKKCPTGAITMVNDYPVFDYAKCDGCGICHDVCPRNLINNFVTGD